MAGCNGQGAGHRISDYCHPPNEEGRIQAAHCKQQRGDPHPEVR